MAKRQRAGDPLTTRQLNRTLLHRRMLLENRRLPALDAVEGLLLDFLAPHTEARELVMLPPQIE